MFNVSDKFKQYITQPERTFEAKVEINGVTHYNDQIVEFEIDDSIVPSDDFTLGAVISSKLTLQIKTIDAVPGNARVTPYIRLYGSEEYTEWVPLGSYYIDSRSYVNEIWTFTCYDKLILTNQIFVSTQVYPATMQIVLDEIAGQLGITLDSSVVINSSYQIPYKDEEVTIHDMLSYIAMAHGASVRLTKDEKLAFVKFQSHTNLPEVEANEYIKVTQTNPVKHYSRIVLTYNDDNETLEAGTGDEANTLNLYNPFMTQTMLNSVLSSLNGFTYVPMTLDWRGRVYLETGDTIAIINGTNIAWDTPNITWENADIPWGGFPQFLTIILTEKLSFKGGLRVTSAATGKSEQQSEFDYQGSLNKALNKMVKQDKPYYGVTIGRDKGLHIEKSDGSSEVILNSDQLAFKAGGQNKLYFDPVAGKYKFAGDIIMEGGSIQWSNVNTPTAAQVGAKPYDWFPAIGEVTGLNNKLTYVDGQGIYTGTLTAGQINAINGIVLGAGASINWNQVNLPTASQVGARPSTWMPTAVDVGARPSTWTPSAAEIGALTTNWVGTTYIDEYGLYTGTISANKINSGTLNAANINVINLNANNITSGTISGNYVSGGTVGVVGIQAQNANIQNLYNSYGAAIALGISGTDGSINYSGGALRLANAGGAYLYIGNNTLGYYTSSGVYYNLLDISGSGYATQSWVNSNFSSIGHGHSGYASSSHSHSEYALASHSHTGYASSSHTHSEYVTTSALSNYATLTFIQQVMALHIQNFH